MALPDKRRNQETADLCKEIDAIETQADRVQRKAITQLFQEGGSVWTALKMREFYALQEEVLDRCEDAAKTIEEILIETPESPTWSIFPSACGRWHFWLAWRWRSIS